MRRTLHCGYRPIAATSRCVWSALVAMASCWCAVAAADPFWTDALARIKSQDAAGSGGISIGYDGFAGGVGGTGHVAVYGNVMVVGAPFDDSPATVWADGDARANSGAVYVIRAPGGDWSNYVIDTFLKESLAPGASIASGNMFGAQVAFDGTTLAVSAPRTDPGAAGKVYVYRIGDTGGSNPVHVVWKDTITDSSTAGLENRHYGHSLAISDRNLFVGVPQDNANNESSNGSDNNYSVKVKGKTTNTYRSGAVYVYYDSVGDGTGYPASTPNKKLKHRSDGNVVEATSAAQFGFAIAYDGAALLVGQPFAGTANGATVYVSSNPTNWASGSITAKNLVRNGIPGAIPGDNSSDRFGFSVAIEGATAFVGAPWEASSLEATNNNSSNWSGAAYLFHSANGNNDWSSLLLVKRLKAMKSTGMQAVVDPTVNAEFGNSVSIKGSHLAVGAREYDPTATVSSYGSQGQSGAVYVFGDANLGGTNQTASDVEFMQLLDYRMHGGIYYGAGGISCLSICEGDLFGSDVALDDSSGTLRLFVTAATESSSAWDAFDNPQPNGSVGYYSGAVFVFGQ